tara:strand:- start:246 stop:533 length:288 start_codon:yes stop_codon:yes gene_type:complete
VRKTKKLSKAKRVAKETKVAITEGLKDFGKSYKFKYVAKEINLTTNVQRCKEITKTMCWRPDIFLDNDRSCGPCSLYENCECVLKNQKNNSKGKK